MEPNSREFYKQCAFQKFCNTVLHNEACDTHRELRRHKAKEVTFSDMTLDEARQLHTFDEYFKRETAETVFEKAGKKITPKLLLEAIRTLPEEKRKAILLYYFEGMNDTEIAELFNTSRSTIQYRRTCKDDNCRSGNLCDKRSDLGVYHWTSHALDYLCKPNNKHLENSMERSVHSTYTHNRYCSIGFSFGS